MKMRKTFLLLAVAMFASGLAAEKEFVELVVEDSGTITIDEPKDDNQGATVFHLKVRTLVRNISDVPITVPTTTYDGRAKLGPCSSESTRNITFTIGSRDGPRGMIKLPPERFFPVVLLPGESAELPEYTEILDDPSLLKSITVTLEINEFFGAKSGWWFGKLYKTVSPVTSCEGPILCILKKISGEQVTTENAGKASLPTAEPEARRP